jgi:hypothetical protein
MDRTMFVLGTGHAVQGAEKKKEQIEDPTYHLVIERLIVDYSLDFIFEEASEQGPTTAEKLARLHHLDYLDVDPSEGHREQYGLAKYTGRHFDICQQGEINAPNPNDLQEIYLGSQLKREKHWIEQINKASFDSALIICGYGHTFTVARDLETVGFNDPMVLTYMPRVKIAKGWLAEVVGPGSWVLSTDGRS